MMWKKLTEAASWFYDNGQLLFAFGTLIAFAYFCWTKSLKGILISGIALITSLFLRW